MAVLTEQVAQGNLTVHFTDTGKETGVYAAMRDTVSYTHLDVYKRQSRLEG